VRRAFGPRVWLVGPGWSGPGWSGPPGRASWAVRFFRRILLLILWRIILRRVPSKLAASSCAAWPLQVLLLQILLQAFLSFLCASAAFAANPLAKFFIVERTDQKASVTTVGGTPRAWLVDSNSGCSGPPGRAFHFWLHFVSSDPECRVVLQWEVG
jgi:hypothetical protein